MPRLDLVTYGVACLLGFSSAVGLLTTTGSEGVNLFSSLAGVRQQRWVSVALDLMI